MCGTGAAILWPWVELVSGQPVREWHREKCQPRLYVQTSVWSHNIFFSLLKPYKSSFPLFAAQSISADTLTGMVSSASNKSLTGDFLVLCSLALPYVSYHIPRSPNHTHPLILMGQHGTHGTHSFPHYYEWEISHMPCLVFPPLYPQGTISNSSCKVHMKTSLINSAYSSLSCIFLYL